MKQQKSKKVRAILAGGLVLGVGAAVTLAAWNDSEFAKETFTAGSFNLQGSATGLADSYTDHADISGALELNFSDELFSNLAPGDTAYAPYWLRLDGNSTVDGTLTPSGVSVPNAVGSNAAAISYTISRVDSGSCGDGITTHPVVASGEDLTKQALAVTPNLALTANASGTPGTAVQLCIAVTAGAQDTFEQKLETTAVWRFNAVPGDAS